MYKVYLYLYAFVVAVFLSSCSQLTKATDIITNPTPREVYQREFKEDTLRYSFWESSFKNAMQDSLSIRLPYVEHGFYYTNNNEAYSYNMNLQQGEQFHLKVNTDTLKTKIFIDLFKKTTDSLKPYVFVERSELQEKQFTYTVKETGDYKIIVQPEIDANTAFALKVYRTPLFYFPVTGKGNAAIQSFWGARRDGGKRSHEGLDIFADRGTPVVAATDGWISSTGNRGLGGKQVWLREGLWGSSLYYAHLDSIAVSKGMRVKTGDTLGFVGNTGNARTTPPHLHFGIYKRYGAVNPLPFVFEGIEPQNPSKEGGIESENIVVKSSKANLRNSAFVKAEKTGEAKRKDTLKLLGETTDWLHIKTKDNLNAFIHKSLVEAI